MAEAVVLVVRLAALQEAQGERQPRERPEGPLEWLGVSIRALAPLRAQEQPLEERRTVLLALLPWVRLLILRGRAPSGW